MQLLETLIPQTHVMDIDFLQGKLPEYPRTKLVQMMKEFAYRRDDWQFYIGRKGLKTRLQKGFVKFARTACTLVPENPCDGPPIPENATVTYKPTDKQDIYEVEYHDIITWASKEELFPFTIGKEGLMQMNNIEIGKYFNARNQQGVFQKISDNAAVLYNDKEPRIFTPKDFDNCREVEMARTDSLKKTEAHREPTLKEITPLINSLKEVGVTYAIIVRDNFVVDGLVRLRAAEFVGLEMVPVRRI